MYQDTISATFPQKVQLINWKEVQSSSAVLSLSRKYTGLEMMLGQGKVKENVLCQPAMFTLEHQLPLV